MSSTKDYEDNSIQSVRDLEDFTRLWLNIGAFYDKIADGTLRIGLKWKTPNCTAKIKVYKSTDIDGSSSYLTDEAAALTQVSGNDSQTYGEVSGNTPLMLPAAFWTGYSEGNPKRCLIFEGSGEGKGELEIVIQKADGTLLGEGGSVWLDLVNVKKMYRRVKATGIADNAPEPSQDSYNQPSDPPMGWEEDSNGQVCDDNAPVSCQKTDDTIVFVHGWNMSYEGSQNYAETMFKRLWQRGFKGRYAFMRWPTLDDSFPTVFFGDIPYTYNASEYRAWKCGESLKQFVNSLPGGSRNLIAHSMGNIVCGSALLKGMVIDNYALLNAAVPAACYDDNPGLDQGWGYTTPHYDLDAGTQNLSYRHKLNSVSGNLINFYLPQDDALAKWEWNNDLPGLAGRFALVGARPQSITSNHYYYYDPSKPVGERLGMHSIGGNNRPVITPDEAMAYVAQSPTKAVGAEGQTAGSINPTPVNMSEPDYNFGNVHSAEFNFTIQKTQPFYYDVLQKLGISQNYLNSERP